VIEFYFSKTRYPTTCIYQQLLIMTVYIAPFTRYGIAESCPIII